ncbi:MAG: 23S rRNA (uracil(1939)-C(5))-methyltransferase RlmD [Lachnospiraceae bacterium]|nr:23S rRNA (uracil(1939)-C(5))-methyltransferase RlmD [Lachnospiraceae bacterium]
MKKGQVLEGIVERVDFPNKGIVKVKEENGEEAVCLVKNVLPGQKISLRIQKKRNGRAQGQLLEVLEKAENEVESTCPHFGACGGCLYHNLSYKDQCGLKSEQVKRLLEPVLCRQGEWKFETIKPSPAVYGYRNKMEFTFGDEVKDGPLSVGLHKRGGFYDIITVSECLIMDEDYRRILTAVRDYFEEKGLPFFHRLRHTGFLRHLLVRKGAKTGEILVALVTTSGIDSVAGETAPKTEKAVPDMGGFAEMLLKLPLHGKIVGILHMANDSVADVVRSDETKLLYGRDYFYEEILGLRFRITAFSFFQTNSLGAEVLYSTAREFIGELSNQKSGEAKRDKVVFDLYSGTGTIAQLMASAAKKVVGVEIVEEAVEAARENAELNGLSNCEFIAGDVLKVLDELEERPDVIILDPPRDGVHPKALKKILAYGVEKIVYISCKPTSLARDLESFLEEGYEVERVVCCDQFPWTGNVETCVLLSRKKSGGKSTKIEIEIDLSEADRRECIGKATYQEIKDYIWEHYQTKVSHLYIAQIKKKCGLDVGENFNKPKTEGNKVPNCPLEKV